MASVSRISFGLSPINASLQLLTYQPKTREVGYPLLSSTARCAGSAASSRTHHQLVGVSRSAVNKIVLGGHSVEMGIGRSVRAKPSLAPR